MGEVGGLYLDGGDEGSGEVGAEARGQGQLADILVFSQGTGDGLLAQQLQARHPVLHTHHVQGWSRSHQQPRVPVAPADGDNGALPGSERQPHVSFHSCKQRKIMHACLKQNKGT